MNPLAVLALFFAGAVIGTLGDQIHVQFGVLSYPHPAPWLYGQASWVPLLFGCAGLALVLGNRTFIRPSLHPDIRTGDVLPATLGEVLGSFVLFVAAYFSTGLFQDHPRLLALGLTAIWLLRIAPRPTRDKLLGGLASAVGGTLFEAALSSTGAFRYRSPDLWLVPIWLPALYLHVSLATRDIYLAWFLPRPHVAVD